MNYIDLKNGIVQRYCGELKREDMKNLPENIQLELYHARLDEDRNTPMDEFLSRYDSIVVDNKIYLTEYGVKSLSWIKHEDYVRNANGDYHTMLIRGISCLIREGKIVKNRYGKDYV